MGYHAAPVV